MNGVLHQLITLTSYGNAYLQNDKLKTDLVESNPAFKYCRSIDFNEFRKPLLFFMKTRMVVVAGDPISWFNYLKRENCRMLRLKFEHSKDQSPDRMDYQLAGLVGGGGTWFIEAVYDKFSYYYVGNWQANHKDDPENKIWSVHYGCNDIKHRTENIQIDNESAKAQLKDSLRSIADFAKEQREQQWAKQFEDALATLESQVPGEGSYVQEFITNANYSLTARQLLFGAAHAWVFGAMGSWNDLGFNSEELNLQYAQLTEQLYEDVVNAFVAGINTF